jgi:type VI secretion system protein VasJ
MLVFQSRRAAFTDCARQGDESVSEPAGRAALGRDPIAGDNPAGVPLVDAADFEALQAELRRDPVLSPPEWPRVVDLGSKLLRDVSKDFRVASYLAYGLAHAEGLRGLRDGLHVLLGMTEVHWDKAFPPVPERARARVNAFDWLSEKAEPLVGAWEVDARDRELVSECAQLANDLAKLVEEKLDGADAGLTRLLSALRGLSSRLPQEQAAPSAPGQPARAGVAVASGPARAIDVEIVADDEVPLLLGRCADYLRKRDSRAPLAYLLPRAQNWCEIDGGPADDGGKIPFNGPDAQQTALFKQLALARDWAGLLEAAEDAGWNQPFWLDSHRYACQALAGLGDDHKLGAAAVKDQVRSLLARAPRLLRLRFNDGTPLADADTQRWIEQEVGSGAAPGGAVRSSAPAPEAADEALEAGRAEARALAAQGDVPGALARLHQALAGDGSPRARFLGRFELACFCAELGRDRLARPIFDELVEDGANHALERWEPELYARVLEAAFRCLDRLAADDPDVRVRAEEVFRRLCRVSPATAAGLE